MKKVFAPTQRTLKARAQSLSAEAGYGHNENCCMRIRVASGRLIIHSSGVSMNPPSGPVPLQQSLRRITLGVCLCMFFVPATASPMFTQFIRNMGATEFHFGLIMGIPMSLFILQFVAAFWNNRIHNRKLPFILLLVSARLLYLLIAFAPVLFASLSPSARIAAVIVIIATSATLANLAVPLWFAWMADLIPRRLLGRYWGNRQRWMFACWTLTYILMALFTYLSPWPVSTTFPVVAVIGVASGVADILLFIRIPEPGNQQVRDVSAYAALMEPFRHTEYRTFVHWNILKSFAVMFGASFMQLYALDVLGMPVWQATVSWCILGVGTALSSRLWGRLADRHGQRPVLLLVGFCKPLVTVVFLLVTPATAFVVLSVWFFFDGMINAGLAVATDGYMLRLAPRRNRSMFIASITGISGIAGGIGTIIAGRILSATATWRWEGLGREWNHYHVIFLMSLVMRLACLPLTFRIREPRSSSPVQLLEDVAGMPPLQFLRFPVGLYRRMRSVMVPRQDQDDD